ncbi:MAG: hypothetical protein CMP91_05900 [Gammaproteobacteria bacterium]|nr:hypothetical protein [Gammaproteobacteria bacterium]|tara:strand:- start:17481 stop:18629 length:1149 start_codon:yes stop_codon:yes gene_type:complete
MEIETLMAEPKSRDKLPGVLCLNPGSSSLKWAFYCSTTQKKVLKTGTVSLERLSKELLVILKKYEVSLVVIRFVHGGTDFYEPVEVTSKVYGELCSIKSFAPLHINTSLLCSELVTNNLKRVKQVAVFDTEIFKELPEAAQLYGLPESLRDKYGIRRFGFHGFAHAGMLEVYQELTDSAPHKEQRIVTIQLGSGCSMAAFLNGNPVECSMGFTPNDGLLMSTRSGEVDAGLVTWIQRQEGWTPDETDIYLNEKSGWAGMSGEGSDFSVILRSQKLSSERAVRLFIHRVRKNLGSFFAVLGGLDAVLLSGGIAENATHFCHGLLCDLEHLGVKLRPAENLSKAAKLTEEIMPLSLPQSKVEVCVIQNNEFNIMLKTVDQWINR